jgi:hypothetical protein
MGEGQIAGKEKGRGHPKSGLPDFGKEKGAAEAAPLSIR